MANSKILTPEDKMKLRQPIDEYVGKIQKQIDVCLLYTSPSPRDA